MAEWIKELLVGAFNMIYPANSIWKACMSCVKMMLVTTPMDIGNGDVWSRVISELYPTFFVIGSSLLLIFLSIVFLKEITDFRKSITIELLVTYGIKLIIAEFLLTNAIPLIKLFFRMASQLSYSTISDNSLTIVTPADPQIGEMLTYLAWGLVFMIVTQAIYYRLLIPDLLLGENVQKAIYLDCDLMLNADISELWNVELGRNVLAAVAETNEGCRYVSSPRALRLYKELGIPEKNKYFNSGVLVMNLEEWRKRNITAKVCNYLTENREQVIYHDQDGLNAILWDSWLELPTDWNVMSYLFITEHKHQVINMEKETVEQLRRNPKIVHFTGWKKPWIEECVHPYASLYRKYAQEVGKICVREE